MTAETLRLQLESKVNYRSRHQIFAGGSVPKVPEKAQGSTLGRMFGAAGSWFTSIWHEIIGRNFRRVALGDIGELRHDMSVLRAESSTLFREVAGSREEILTHLMLAEESMAARYKSLLASENNWLREEMEREAPTHYLGRSDVLITTKRGFQIICDGRDIAVTPKLVRNREWDVPLGALIQRHLPPGGSYLEIGAHIGYFTLFAAGQVGHTGSVYAFESNPHTFGYLTRNCRLNDCAYLCHLYNLAIYREETRLPFYAFEANLGGSTLATYGKKSMDEFMETPKTIEVSTTTLDIFMRDKTLAFDFIKIDAEGSEMAIFAGGHDFFSRCLNPAAVISLEFNPPALEGMGDNPADLIELIRAGGFYIQDRTHPSKLRQIERASELDAWRISELVLSRQPLHEALV